jgi:hypothetical protein
MISIIAVIGGLEAQESSYVLEICLRYDRPNNCRRIGSELWRNESALERGRYWPYYHEFLTSLSNALWAYLEDNVS